MVTVLVKLSPHRSQLRRLRNTRGMVTGSVMVKWSPRIARG